MHRFILWGQPGHECAELDSAVDACERPLFRVFKIIQGLQPAHCCQTLEEYRRRLARRYAGRNEQSNHPIGSNQRHRAFYGLLFRPEAMLRFAQIGLDEMPDETPICRFRHFLERHGIQRRSSSQFELLLRRLHARNCGELFASKSTRRKRPKVSGRLGRCPDRRTPPPGSSRSAFAGYSCEASSGAFRHVMPRSVSRRSTRTPHQPATD